MEEHFLAYLLGTLDSVTHARVETYLEEHPQARERLALLEQALAPLAEDPAPSPPPGLAIATLARIAEYRCKLPPAPRPSSHQFGSPTRRLFRLADGLVAALLLLLVGGILVPFAANQWAQQQRVACSNNLRQFWVSLSAYADRSEGEFPRVESEGPRAVAGIFVPILDDAGLARDVTVFCPGLGQQETIRPSLSELERLYRDAPEQYRERTRDLAGHYAYCLGYHDSTGALRGLRRDSGEELPILADRAETPASNSSNHGGKGQNVLYVGGYVRWASQPHVGPEQDHIYINHLHRVQAGLCRTDSVLGSSSARPFLGN